MQNIKILNTAKSERIKSIFSANYNKDYANTLGSDQIEKDIKYISDIIKENRKLFGKKLLGEELYFDNALRLLRSSKRGNIKEKARMMNYAIEYINDYKLTGSLFEIQKNLISELMNGDEFSSVVKQSKELNNKRDIVANDFTDQQLCEIFEVLYTINKDLAKYEDASWIGYWDEVLATIEVKIGRAHV